jgi:TP901 family phage tail tape measure protein
MNITEIFRTRIEIDGQQSVNEIGKLELQMKDLKAAIKSIPKETEAWKQAADNVKFYEKAMQKNLDTIEKNNVLLEIKQDKINKVKAQLLELTAAENKDEAQIKSLNQELQQQHAEYDKLNQKTHALDDNYERQLKIYTKLKASLKDITQETTEYTVATAQLKTVETRLQEVREKTGLLGMTMGQLKSQQKEYNQALNNLTFGTEKYEEVKKKLQELNAVIAHQQNDLRDTRTGWQKFKDEIRGFGVATLGNIGGEIAMRAFDGMTQALVGTVTQAAKLSDELVDMQRFTGNTAEATKELNAELSKVYTRTGTGELRGITMVGGALGVVKEEVKGFIVEIDKANVVLEKEFGGNAEKVANGFGKIKNIFAETKSMKWEEAMSRIASATIAAGSASAAQAPEILDFTQRIGAIGELGPKLTESLGLGTAMLDLGLSSEIASSGLQALFITAGKESEAFAAQMGISIEQFKKLQNESPNKMLIELAKSFKGLDNAEVLAGLQRIGITSGETVKVMALLKDNTEKVVAAQTLMSDEFNNNTKLQEAFNLKMSTFGAQVDLAKKEINGLVAGLTSALLPAMTKIVEKTVAFVIILKELPKFISENKEVIYTLVVALAAFNWSLVTAQANILRTNLGLKASNAILRAKTILLPILTAATAAWNAVLALNPLGLVIIAVAALVVGMTYLYNTNEKVKRGLDTLWEAYKTFVSAVVDFWVNVLTLDFSGAFDTLITAFKKVKNIFAEGITPKINEPVGNKLQTPEFKKQQQKQNKKDAGDLLYSFESEDTKSTDTSKTSEISAEDAALIAANKKRAADAALADKAENDKKDAAAKESLAKKNEERRKLTEQALKDLHDMELRMMEEGQAKETLLLEDKYSEMGKKIEESILKGLPKEIAQKQFDLLFKDFDTEKEKITEKYRKLGIENANAESEAIIKTKKELQEKELAAIEANKANKDAKATLQNLDNKNNLVEKSLNTENPDDKVAINEEIIVADNLFKQNLLDNELWLAEQKLAIHTKYGTLTEEQERALLIKQQEIEAQKTQNTIAEAERRRLASQAEFKATLTAASGLVGALGNLQNAMGQDGESWIDFKNGLTLAQIGIDTASAISSLTAASSANPTNAVTFGAAGAIQFATGVVSIMANIAKATSILAGTNKPKAAPSKAANTSSSGGGNSGYFDGGTQREGAGYTGGSSIYEPITFIGHGGEYIIPNWMMRQAPIANFAGILEGIRTNKTNVNSLYSQNQGNKTYFDGGMMTNTNSQSVNNQQNTINLQLMQMINTLSEKVANVNAQPAKVVLRDISEANLQEQILEQDVKI